jgi:hypothetical protein
MEREILAGPAFRRWRRIQVFQLGIDEFDDARNELKSLLAKRNLKADVFIAPPPGQPVVLTSRFVDMKGLQKAGVNR